jgi:hypothetical protein
MKILQYIMLTALIIITIDFLGLLAWVYSGQVPADNFFIGSITYHLLHFIK